MTEAIDIEMSENGFDSERKVLDAPGTALMKISAEEGPGDSITILEPKPTLNPNDPLNWSSGRKAVNFAIVSVFTLLVFALIDIGPVIWQDFEQLLHISYPQLNNQYAVNCVSLGLGSICLVPLALKFGRRPIYLLTTVVVLVTTIWQAVLRDLPNMMAAQVFNGLACAVGWTLVPITITDLFFVHQRGRANSIYQLMSSTGVFLAPVAAGYIADSQGWPWIYWWCAIFVAVNLVLFIFFFEETKFSIQTITGLEMSALVPDVDTGTGSLAGHYKRQILTDSSVGLTMNASPHPIELHNWDEPSIPRNTWRQRLAIFTPSTEPSSQYISHLYRPLQVLVTIPAVTYVTIQYSSTLVWFAVVATTQSQYFSLPPYNFGTIGIGLLNLSPFIGSVFGCAWGGPLSDWSIQVLARRNENIYEPEMRLYISIVPGIVGPAGLFLYGYTIAEGLPWILPCLGSGLYGFSMAALIPIVLVYLSDSYHKILGTALIGVSFVQYMCATLIVFVLDPWINNMGLYGTFTLIGCLALGCNLLCIPMILFGKKWRISSRAQYERMSEVHVGERA